MKQVEEVKAKAVGKTPTLDTNAWISQFNNQDQQHSQMANKPVDQDFIKFKKMQEAKQKREMEQAAMQQEQMKMEQEQQKNASHQPSIYDPAMQRLKSENLPSSPSSSIHGTPLRSQHSDQQLTRMTPSELARLREQKKRERLMQKPVVDMNQQQEILREFEMG